MSDRIEGNRAPRTGWERTGRRSERERSPKEPDTSDSGGLIGGLFDSADEGLRKFHDVVDDGADSVRRGASELADGAKDGVRRAGELANEAKRGVEEGVENVEQTLDNARRDAENFASGVKDGIERKGAQLADDVEHAKRGAEMATDMLADSVEKSVNEGIDGAEELAVDTANRVEKSVDSGVDEARTIVRAAEVGLKAKLDEQRDRLSPGTPAPNPAAERIHEFAAEIQEQTGLTLEDYPQEEVAELGEKFIEGDISFGEAVHRLSQIKALTDEELEADLGVVGLEVAHKVAEGVQGMRDEIESITSGAMAYWDNPIVSAVSTYNPLLLSTRAVSMELIETAGNLPELADQFVDNKDRIRDYIEAGSIGRATQSIEELQPGESFKRGSTINVGGAMGIGAEVPISVHAEVEQTGEDTYQVTLETAQGLSGLVGEKLGEGIYGEAGASGTRTIVFEVSGPDAARDAALLATGDTSSPAKLSLLSQEPEVISGNFELGIALGGDLTGARLDTDFGDMTGFRKEGDTIILEKQLSAQLSEGYETPVYVQLNDELEDAIQGGDYDIAEDAHPSVRHVMDQVPDEFLDHIREAHGQTVGTSIGFEAGGSAKYSYNTDTGAHGLTLQTRLQAHAGKTTYELTHTVDIEDVEAFEQTLQDITGESWDLVAQSKRGEISQDEIMALVDEHRERFTDSVDFTTKVDAEYDDTNKARIADHEMYDGTVRTETLFEVTDEDILHAYDGLMDAVLDDGDDSDLDGEVMRGKLGAYRKQ
jgi:hypothetical protein